MRLSTHFPYWRDMLYMSCIILLLIIALWMEASDLHFIHAAGGSANFSLQPASFDPDNPLTQSYFIFNTRPLKFVSGRVRVTNDGTARGTVSIYPVDATTSPSGGLAYLETTQHLHDVGAWVALSKVSLALDPGQSKNIAFSLFVPRNATSGQHVGGIVAENTSLQNTSSPVNKGTMKINLTMKKLYALPIVVNIPGTIREQLSTFGAVLDNASLYQRILIDLTNTGNTIIYPKGSATIIDSRGSIVQTTILNLNAFLPATSIEYPLTIMKKALPVGIYRVKLVLNYGKYVHKTLNTIFHLKVRKSGKSLATLASSVVQEPTAFLRSLALWQYVLAVIALLLVGSALFFWIQKVYTLVVNIQHKGRSHKI